MDNRLLTDIWLDVVTLESPVIISSSTKSCLDLRKTSNLLTTINNLPLDVIVYIRLLKEYFARTACTLGTKLDTLSKFASCAEAIEWWQLVKLYMHFIVFRVYVLAPM